jgi:ABC-type multidrug transport system fused ATPase/permease subunit
MAKQENRNTLSTSVLVRRFLPYFRKYRKTMAFDLCCAALTTVCELVLPLIVAVTLIQWVVIFFTQFSTVIFNLLAGLMFLITIAGWMFGISAGAETLQLLAVAFVVFIIPHIAEWLIIRIAVINYGLRDFIKS